MRNTPRIVTAPDFHVKVQMLLAGEVQTLTLSLSGDVAWRRLQDAVLAGEAFRDEEVILSSEATKAIFSARVV